jgi:phage terminase small subunit
MTRKQQLFADEYVKDFNGRQAAVRAGFAEAGAAVSASRMLNNPNILAIINQRLELVRVKKNDDEEYNHSEIRKCFRAIYDRCMQAEPVMQFNYTTKQMEHVRDENGNAVYMFDANGAARAMENIAKNKGFYELDNSQKKAVIQIAIVNNGNTDNEDAGNTDQLTDTGVFTLLPPTTEG